MDVFPNILDFNSKGKYLGYLVLQFIKTVINVMPISDRHYIDGCFNELYWVTQTCLYHKSNIFGNTSIVKVDVSFQSPYLTLF